MSVVVAFLLPVAAIWLAANALGWVSIRDAGARPWSWRALAGPWLYYRWLDRQP